MRKGYHLLAVALFLPALLSGEGALLGVALAGALTALLAAEALRVSGLPGIGGEQASVGVGWGGQGMSEHLPACCSSRCEKEGA